MKRFLRRTEAALVLIFICFSVFSEGEKISDKKSEQDKDSVIESIKKTLEDNPPRLPDAGAVLAKEEPYLQIVKGKDSRITVIYRFRNIKSKSAVDSIEGIVSLSGTVEELAEQNIIVVNDVESKEDEIKEALIALDVPMPQILVEAKVIEIYVDDGMERDLRLEYNKTDAGDGLSQVAGYNLNAPGQNTFANQGAIMDLYPYSSGFTGGTVKDVNVFLRWLKRARDAKILSSPNLIVDLGSTASMVTGEDVPIIQTQVNGGTVTTSTLFKRIGVKLNVTPVIINKDSVKLKINPDVSSIIRFEPFTQNNITVNNPVVAIRNIETELVASDNDIILIGGLYSSEKIKSTRRIPFVSEIPLLGELFTSVDESDVKKQLVFFLRIKILKGGKGFIAYDIEKTAEELDKVGQTIRDSDKLFPRPENMKKK
jgi:type II secretory pathway component GspD/PulD (secretin)